MTDGLESGPSTSSNNQTPVLASITVQAAISHDKRSVALKFSKGENTLWETAADTASIESMIAALGQSRSQMLDIVPSDIPEGVHPLAAYNPRWYVLPDADNRFATLWIRHPGLGWSGFGFPHHEAASIAKFLRKIVAITSAVYATPPGESSFGGDKFLVTSAGLGFYWYGKGERRIGPNPFAQVEYDSDRAAGIVAGSILERRLEEALRSRMKSDQVKISQNLFRPSGALGPFSTKIDLAYLLGFLSDGTYQDLTTIKNIRNDFAHELEIESFDVQSIKDRCKKLTLVERHVGPVPATDGPKIDRPDPYLGLPDYQQKLAEPRFRYVMTAQLISNRLGECADHLTDRTPWI